MNLSNLCLKVIEGNFDSFVADFLSPNGKVPPHHFEFLQRRYSKELLKSMLKKSKLPDDYYKFLINIYLKELKHAKSRNFCSVDILIERLIEVGESITNLDLSHAKEQYSEDDICKIVSLVPNVEKLTLSRTRANDAIFKAIRNYSSLHSLNLDYCKITDSGLEQLCERDENGQFHPNRKLKQLTIHKTMVTQEGVMFALMKFPSLEILDHIDVPHVLYMLNIFLKHVSPQALDTVSKFNLTMINLDELLLPLASPCFRGNKAHFIAEMLGTLVFLCPKISNLIISNLSKAIPTSTWALFSNLQELSISCCGAMYFSDKIGLTSLVESSLTSLKSIRLENVKLSADSLLKFSKLEKLCLYCVKLEPISEDLTIQSNAFPHLSSIDLCSSQRLNEDMERTIIFFMESSPNLESLKLEFRTGDLDDDFVDKMCACHCIGTLKNLGLYGLSTQAHQVLKLLMHARDLTDLSIDDSDISSKEKRKINSMIRAEGRSLRVYWVYSDEYYNTDGSEQSLSESMSMSDNSSFFIDYDDEDDMDIGA